MEYSFYWVLILIKCQDKLLLLNREKTPWMGMWNGIGGKKDENETAIACAIRETKEETGININKENLFDKGYICWNKDKKYQSGLHLFLYEVNELPFKGTKKTEEGILEFKDINWILKKDNVGVVPNMSICLDKLLNSKDRFLYLIKYKKNGMITKVRVTNLCL